MMNSSRIWQKLVVGGCIGACGLLSALAQQNKDRAIENFDRLVAATKALQVRLGPQVTNLSGASRLPFIMASRETEIRTLLQRSATTNSGSKKISGTSGTSGFNIALTNTIPRGGFANDPTQASDRVSRFAGATQNEPSIAWWGSDAVVAFNDSGSLIESVYDPRPSPSGSFSFIGWSIVTMGGDDTAAPQFRDRGVFLPDPLPKGITFMSLTGDPVVKASGPRTFFLSSAGYHIDDQTNAWSSISVYKSVDGGRTFGGASIASAKSYATHILDKEWMAVNSNTVVVAYRDVDATKTCGANQNSIEVVRSGDGGLTWSNPVVLDSDCDNYAFSRGVRICFGPNGVLYLVWEHFASDNLIREVRFTSSTDDGLTFGLTRIVTSITPAGDGMAMQGWFRAYLDLQGFAVDTSGGTNNGRIYISWHDGRYLSQTDPLTIYGGAFYNFADILLSSSSDGGDTWSAPVRVNQDSPTNQVDQFFPAVAVDGGGQVGVVFYDRRKDPRNYLMDVVVAQSPDGGQTWRETQVNPASFSSVVAQDWLTDNLDMGNYISLAADASGAQRGFLATWGDNSLGDPNVQVRRVPYP